ncbi:hypothetical protein B7494_g4883 [Chlorociboria aeruginascens]|nr:hypothetical protein B7494_g4883 [Chlorociboria aeruginascens]
MSTTAVAEIVDDYERMKQEEHEANLRRKKRAVKLEKEVIKVEPASPASPDFSIAPISPYVDIKEEDFSDDEHIKASITPVHFSIEDFSDDENIFPSKPLSTFWKRSPSQPIKRELEEADFPDFKKIKQEPPD